MTTKFLDLDTVAAKVEFTLKLNGATHEMVEPTVEDFASTMKELEEFALNATPRQELELSIRMIRRGFPTIDEAELRALKLSQLREISAFVRQAGGEDVKQETKDEEGNGEAAS